MLDNKSANLRKKPVIVMRILPFHQNTKPVPFPIAVHATKITEDRRKRKGKKNDRRVTENPEPILTIFFNAC